jgi:hypothetical protein
MAGSSLVSRRPKTHHAKACLGFERNSSVYIASSPVSAEMLEGLPPFPFANSPVFICIDIERAACQGQQITEIGLTVLDTRDLGPRNKPQLVPGTPPGNRGHSWFKFLRTTHLRVSDHPHENCRRSYCKGSPGSFAFARSSFVKIGDLKRRLEEWYRNVELLRLAVDEKKRHVIVLTFASYLEETELRIQDVSWFQKVDEAWDIQKMGFAMRIAAACSKQKPSLQDLIEYLGIASQDAQNRLLHNAGNDSAFELQCMLAGLLLTPVEWAGLGSVPLSPLPQSWKEHNIKANNELQLVPER